MFKFFLPLFLACSTLCASTTAQTFLNEKSPSYVYAGPIYRYTTLDAKGIGDFDGNEWGAYAAYEYIKLNSFYAKVGFECELGSVKDGPNRIGQQDYDVMALIGYVAAPGDYKRPCVIPYVGYGYYLILEHLEITGFADQDYTYKLPYIPIGLALLFKASSVFTFGVNYHYQWYFDPHLTIKSLEGSAWELSYTGGQMIDLSFIFNWSPHFGINFEPFYQLIRLGKSTAITNFGTPLGIQKQVFQNAGLKASLMYSF